MVRIAPGCDIPNLSKIIDDAFDSITDIYHSDPVEFDSIDTDVDIGMNDDFGDYVPDMDIISESIDDTA